MLIDALAEFGYEIKGFEADLKMVNPVVIQCFEENSLRLLRELTDIPLVRLINNFAYWTNGNLLFLPSLLSSPYVESLTSMAEYVDGVGPSKVWKILV